MKKIYLFIIALAIITTAEVSAQNWVLNQVIVGSGGNFSDPDENVILASYNPNNETTTDFGSIITQSIQDLVIDGKYVYIAAQDSIAKYDLDSYERLAISEALGVNRLCVASDKVIASFQFPATENFVRVFNADDLSFISSISDVSGETAGIVAVDQLIYVAVNGGWAGTTGSIAIIELSDFSLVNEVDLGTEGRSIMDLFYHNDMIMSVNTTPWGDSTAYISTMNRLGSHFESFLIPQTVGDYVGIKDNMLYTVMNYGIGAIDLSDFTVDNTSVISAPSMTISSAILDTVNNDFYVATTDYFSTGEGIIYNFIGEEKGSFDAGISPDAIALDYRDNTSISESEVVDSYIFPNPSSTMINIKTDLDIITDIYITDISGRTIVDRRVDIKSTNISVDVSQFNSGIYLVKLKGVNHISTTRFIKN